MPRAVHVGNGIRLAAIVTSSRAIRGRCLYCDTFDCAFWIDHDPGHPGLTVAAGDSGHGFKFAPVLGGLIAGVVGRKPNPWAARYRWRSRVHVPADTARA